MGGFLVVLLVGLSARAAIKGVITTYIQTF